MVQITEIFRLSGGDGKELYDYLMKSNRKKAVTDGLNQFDPKRHDVAKKSKRPDKIIFVPTGEKDPITKEDIITTDTAPVARVPLAIQKYIIKQKASFAVGSGVILRPTNEKSRIYEFVYNNWIDNKTDFYLTDIFTKCKAETQAAVIFSGERGKERFEDFKFRMKIVSPSTGDLLYPFYDDDTGDLVAFGREYKRGKKTIYDLYLKNGSGVCEIRRYENARPMLTAEGEYFIIPLPYKKLPVIYWEQDRPECDDTSELMDELESGFSDFLTQQGYSADPILFGKGTTLDLPARGQAGKYIEGSGDSDLKFITPDNATESRQLQFSMLQKFIFSLNNAVLIDMETMKALGNVSGETLKRYLTDALLEASRNQQGHFGMGVQRMVNWLVSEWGNLIGEEADARINVEFTEFSTSSEMDKVELAVKANGGLPVVDLEGGISIAGLSEDVAKTLQNIQAQGVSVAPVRGEVAE